MWSDVLIPAIIFGAGVAIVKIITDTKTRHRLIDKGMVNENVKHLFIRNAELQRLSSLKWGMVLVGIGAALLISYIWPDLFDEGGTVGLIFIFAGIAFLIYYGVAQKSLKGNDTLKR